MRQEIEPETNNFKQLFEATWEAFAEACTRFAAASSIWLDVGGSIVRLRFAGPAMMPQMLPAPAHLQVPPQPKADLEVGVWDSASTAVPMTPPPWTKADYLARGEIRDSDLQTAVQAAYHPGSGLLSLLHTEQQRAVVWMNDAAQLPYYEQAAPLRTIFHWWSTRQSQQLVHGAAIGSKNGAVLLTGKGGSGKSTTAVTSLLAGLGYLGDDYVLCEVIEAGVTVHSLFNSAKIDAHSLTLLPQLAGKIANEARLSEEKGILYAHTFYPEQLLRSAPLRAIVIPQVTTRTNSHLQPIKSSLAFLALAPTTVFQLPGAGETAVTFLRQLVTQLPCYQLQLGRDLSQIPPTIHSLLGALA
jgi:hypothetical protein